MIAAKPGRVVGRRRPALLDVGGGAGEISMGRRSRIAIVAVAAVLVAAPSFGKGKKKSSQSQ